MSVQSQPPWLADEAEIHSLLHRVLDRFDRQAGDERRRAVTLSAEKHLSSLARADLQADQTWALVRELERLGVLAARPVRRNPLDPEWQGAKLAFTPGCEATLREWLGRERAEQASVLWRRAVDRHAAAFPQGLEELSRRRIVIPGRSPDEVVRAIAGIASLGGPLTLRQLSASVFWGDSKVLDDRGDLVAALFPMLEIRERAIVVAVHLPESCRGTVFIENQDTYTAACGGAPPELRELALVYAAGFRGAAARVRLRGGALLHYAGPGVASHWAFFERWWRDQGGAPGPCWFWGDLDFAGMQILKSLRGRFEGLAAWRPGYEPMLAALRSSGGYRPTESAEPGQSDPGSTGCGFADTELLPAIRSHGQMDQERLIRTATLEDDFGTALPREKVALPPDIDLEC